MATFTNQATLSYSGGTTNSNIVTGEIVDVLSATKTAVTDTYSTPDKITYIISLVNSGTTALTGLTVSDDLGGYTAASTTVYPLTYTTDSIRYYTNGTLQATPTVSTTAPLAITGISVPAGGNATIVYETSTNEYTPKDTTGSVANTATISGTTLTSDVTATETVTPTAAPDLSITKSVSPSTVSEDGQLTYTFLIENSGNTAADAADNVIITDTFNPILTSITVTYNGTTWAATTNYTYNATSGAFATVAGQITVPAATYTQDSTTGVITTTPGTAVVTVTGTL